MSGVKISELPAATVANLSDVFPVVQSDTTKKLTLQLVKDLFGSGSGTVTTVSVVTANGVSGSVANATTTPAITLVLGAITPSSVAAVGSVTGSNLSGTNTGDQTITLTGDVTGSGTGSFVATIAANVVTNAKLAQMATHTIKGNAAGGTANAADLTGTQATALLDLFTTSLQGLAPASGGGTVNFLRADGTWAVPPGSGGSGTVTTVSVVTANGVSGSVANATTTPAITLVLGAITPSSVAAVGSVTGSNLSGTNTGDQTITLTGDVTGSGTGSFTATIAANVVTNAKLAQMATHTIKGNKTGGTANAADLTGTEVTALLDLFTSSLQGLVPSSGGGTSNFLRADGGWAVPPGTATGTVTTVSVVTANGVSGSVANATTAPAITLTLGAITPSSVAASGAVSGSNLSGTNTGDQTITLTGDVTGSGTGSFVATIAANVVTNAKLAQMATHTIKGNATGGTANAADLTGTQVTALLDAFTTSLQGLAPASGGGTTNFLRADGTWAAPPGATSGTVTSVSVVTANGVSGSVATATTTPAITLVLGNITPTSVASTGRVSANLNSGSAPTPLTGTAFQGTAADGVVARVELNSFGAIAAFTTRRANGTAASPTAIASGDQISGFNAYGYYVTGGPAYSGVQATVAMFATENWTSTANGTQVKIRTTPNGSTTMADAFTVDGSGNAVSIGTMTATRYIGLVDDRVATFVNGGSALAAGAKIYVQINYACTVSNWTVLADQSGSCVMEIKRSTYASFPTVTSIIGGGNAPTLSSVQKNTAAPSGWTSTALVAGDTLEISLTSSSTITFAALILKLTRT